MTDRGKWLFWGSLAIGFTLLVLPSTLLLQTVLGYRDFLDGLEPGTLHQTADKLLRRDDSSVPGVSANLPKIEFVTFRIHAPKAKSVSLIGGFNAWKNSASALNKQRDGWWQIVLTLPAGKYNYLFLVDGKPTQDPRNRGSEESDGRQTSIKIVK